MWYLDELVCVDFDVVHVCYLFSVECDWCEGVGGVCWFRVDAVEVRGVAVCLCGGVVYSVYSECYCVEKCYWVDVALEGY